MGCGMSAAVAPGNPASGLRWAPEVEDHEPDGKAHSKPSSRTSSAAWMLQPWELQHSRASAAIRSTDHVSQCAVSLEWIISTFLEKHPDIDRERLTTGQVVTQIVQPATEQDRCRYIAKLMWGDDAAPSAVSRGRSFFFISHGWSRPFVELVDMLKHHFSPEQQRVWRQGLKILPPSQVFVWLDIFAINQHPGEGQRGDLGMLKEVLADADQTLMVLDPKGAVLTRIWCLYEAWQTSRKGRGRLVIMSYDIKLEPLQQVFLELDVASAQATVKDDLDRILVEIEADVGVHTMNHDLKNALVASAVAEVPCEAQWAPELGYKLEKAAQLLQLYGRLDEAEPLYRRDLGGRKLMLGPDHPSTLVCMNNLASLLYAMGKYDESEKLYKNAEKTMERKASTSPDAQKLATRSNLAALLKARGQYAEAKDLYRQTVEELTTHLGKEHADTLAARSNLASLLYCQAQYDEAETIYRQVIETSERVLGPKNPATLTSVNGLATLLKARGKYDEAEQLFKRAVADQQSVLGNDHQDHHASLNNLASLLYAQGRHTEAEPLYRDVIRALQGTLGPEHPNFLTALNNLAMVLKALNKLDEAESMYRQVLTSRTKILGEEHPNTLTSMNNLAMLLKSNGKLKDAEPLCKKTLQGRTKVLGENHPNTLSALSNLASVIKELGRFDEAEAMFRTALKGRMEALGPSHPDTKSSMEWLTTLLEQQNRNEEAAVIRFSVENPDDGV